MPLIAEAKAQWANAAGVAIERQYVLTACRAITEDENLAPAFGTQVDEVVARAAQKAGEVEVACLEQEVATYLYMSSGHCTFSSKKSYRSNVSDACWGTREAAAPNIPAEGALLGPTPRSV